MVLLRQCSNNDNFCIQGGCWPLSVIFVCILHFITCFLSVYGIHSNFLPSTSAHDPNKQLLPPAESEIHRQQPAITDQTHLSDILTHNTTSYTAVGNVSENKIPCPICEQKFTTSQDLNKHLVSHNNGRHPQQVTQIQLESAMNPDENKIVCPLCSKAFKKKYNFKLHMMKHTGEVQMKRESNEYIRSLSCM